MQDSVRVSDMICHEDSNKSVIIIKWGSRNQEAAAGVALVTITPTFHP